MNIKEIKKGYDIFVRDESLTYLDSCATSLTPRVVTAKLLEYYNSYNANIARGAYKMSVKATEEFEQSRKYVASFVNAQSEEIVFTSGTTASLNMIAHGLASQISDTDNIVVTAMEHHANFIPWQEICKKTNAEFRVASITNDGILDVDALLDLIDANTKILALTHVSNVLGTINPIKEIIQKVKKKNPKTIVVIDAAQSVSHLPVDVIDIGCDFLAFSMHKLFGPTGVGVLCGKKDALEKLEPVFTGGEMIQEVTKKCTTFRELPHRLEAGTPNIAGVIATKEAIAYIKQFDFTEFREHEEELLTYCSEQMSRTFGNNITIYGPTDVSQRSGAISFTFKNHHPHDIASILDDKKNIALRAGQHCAMPLHLETLKVSATARASFSIYNSKEDIDKLIEGLKEVDNILK
ncbi:MAG: SufS family cysteine desulfurase [Patescibacteria group bacterium]|nr:SufS family cysteine desulfurase [Patescibacteria group bacterium]